MTAKDWRLGIGGLFLHDIDRGLIPLKSSLISSRVSVLLAFVGTQIQHESSANSCRCKICASTLEQLTACKLLLLSFMLDLYTAMTVQFLRLAYLVKMSFVDAHIGFELTLEREMLAAESLHGGPNFSGQFLEEALVEDFDVLHEHNFLHNVGRCFTLLSL